MEEEYEVSFIFLFEKELVFFTEGRMEPNFPNLDYKHAIKCLGT